MWTRASTAASGGGWQRTWQHVDASSPSDDPILGRRVSLNEVSRSAPAEGPLRGVPSAGVEWRRSRLARPRVDRAVLDDLRREISPLRDRTRRIHPRTATTISLVATDGGNNKIQFDPFLIQIVRVVDSSNNEYCLEAVTPTTDLVALSG